LPNGLRSEWDNAGNTRCAGALGQLQQRQGAQDDPNLLHTATQQLAQFLLVLLCDGPEKIAAILGLGADGCVLMCDPVYYSRFGFIHNPALVLEAYRLNT
jgi:hypothetical protein